MSSLASEQRSLTELVADALAGRRDAWDAIVRRLERVAWKAIRTVDLPEWNRENAFQNTWLRLHQSLARIDDPERLPGWIATTARREALAESKRSRREVAVESFDERPANQDDPDHHALDHDLLAAVWVAFSSLSTECQELLRFSILSDPPLSYEEIAEILGRTHGGVGPTRQRCLEKMRRHPALSSHLRGHHER